MALTTETTIAPLGGWPRGLNKDAFELLLSADESPSMLNVDLGIRGEFEVRDGFTRWSTGDTSVAQLIHPYLPGAGTDVLVIVEVDGSIWQGTSSTMVDQSKTLGAASNERDWNIDAVELDDDLYIFSMRGNTWRWDGSTWVEITDVTLNEGGTALSPEAPQAATAVSHNSRIFVGNINASGSLDRSRVQWSRTPVENAGDAGGNRWRATSFIDVQEGDGTEIRKLAIFQGSILVFKDHSIYDLSGFDEDSFTLYPVDHKVGTTAPNSIAYSESDIFWFDPSKGVHVYDGNKVSLIDASVHNHILAGINQAVAYKSHGVLKDGKYFLSVPWGSDTFNSRTFVFDTRLGAWAEYDYGWFDTAVWSNLWYTVGNENTVGIYKFQQADSLDITTGVAWHLETVWFPPTEQQGMTRWRLRRADLWVEADSGALTVEIFVDGGASAVKTYSLTATTNRLKLAAYSALWEIIKFKFSGTTT